MTLWLITKNCPTMEEQLENVITILPNKKYIGNYIYRHITTTHLSHYTKWCENHNMDSSLMTTVVNYVNTCWGDCLDDYAVVKQRFNPTEMARTLRMLAYSLPVGGEWETQDEMTNYCEFTQACATLEEKVGNIAKD